ncbi:hypothetical protein GOODEAATRI_032141 [Goodea atripinnis]|uniref:Uncharacterized protein n=1 Tax=Goodea atripinnis TaxID=208336 RepID=A0ABV0NPV0_9TELE
MRGVYLNDHVGGVSGCNRLSPRKSKLRRRLISKKENPTPSELSSIKDRKSDALNTPLRIIIISPEHTPDKLRTAVERKGKSKKLFALFVGECVIIDLFNPQIKLFTDLTEDVSLKEEEEAGLFKQTKPNNELAINSGQSSAVKRQDSSKDATMKLTPRRSLFKDQYNVSHKRISSVQQEAKSGPNIHPRVRKYLTPAKRQRLSALHTRATLVRGLMSEVTLMVGQIRSRLGQQQRRKKVSPAARDHRNKASSLTILVACQTLIQKLSGDIKVILN